MFLRISAGYRLIAILKARRRIALGLPASHAIPSQHHPNV
jgi:hypothetical protein